MSSLWTGLSAVAENGTSRVGRQGTPASVNNDLGFPALVATIFKLSALPYGSTLLITNVTERVYIHFNM